MYTELVPLALERGRELLSCLSDRQAHAFSESMSRLEETLELGDPVPEVMEGRNE